MTTSAWKSRLYFGDNLDITPEHIADYATSVGPDRQSRDEGTVAGVAATSRAYKTVSGCGGRSLPTLAGKSVMPGASV